MTQSTLHGIHPGMRRANYEPGRCGYAYWSVRFGILCWPLFVLTALGRRFQLIDEVSSFFLMGVTFLIAGLAILLALVAFRSIWKRGTLGLRRAVEGLLLGASVALFPVVAALAVIAYPTLNDISTDLLSPPAFEAAHKDRTDRMNRPGDVLSDEMVRSQRQAYPEVTGKLWQFEPETIIAAVRAEIAQRDWRLLKQDISVDGREITMELVSRSLVFAFEDDVVIRMRVYDDLGVRVDMRSASRWGRHDLGANARRIKVFLDDVELRLQGSPRESLVRLIFGRDVGTISGRRNAPDEPSNVPRSRPDPVEE